MTGYFRKFVILLILRARIALKKHMYKSDYYQRFINILRKKYYLYNLLLKFTSAAMLCNNSEVSVPVCSTIL